MLAKEYLRARQYLLNYLLHLRVSQWTFAILLVLRCVAKTRYPGNILQLIILVASTVRTATPTGSSRQTDDTRAAIEAVGAASYDAASHEETIRAQVREEDNATAGTRGASYAARRAVGPRNIQPQSASLSRIGGANTHKRRAKAYCCQTSRRFLWILKDQTLVNRTPTTACWILTRATSRPRATTLHNTQHNRLRSTKRVTVQLTAAVLLLF